LALKKTESCATKQKATEPKDPLGCNISSKKGVYV